MKKLLLVTLFVGLCTETIVGMKRKLSEESEEHDTSDREMEQADEVSDSPSEEPVKQQRGKKRTRDKVKEKGKKSSAKVKKPSRKKSKNVRFPAKDATVTPLMKMVKDKNREEVTALVESGVDVSAADAFENTALVYAAETGDIELVKLVYDKILSGSTISRALIVACACGHKDIAEFLITHRADVDFCEKGLFLSGIYAIDEESVSKFRMSITSPLLVAAYFGHLAIVELLLNKNADININGQGQRVPLTAALESGHDDLVELLLKRGAHILPKNNQVKAPLIVAAMYNRDRWVQEFLPHQKNKNQRDIIRALVECIRYKHMHLTDTLMPHITDEMLYMTVQGARPRNSPAALTFLGELGKEDILELLFEKALDKNKAYTYALIGAVSANNKVLAEKLIKRGANVNGYEKVQGRYSYHDVPLSKAIDIKNVDMIKLLLQAGAHIEDIQNCTYSISRAREKGDEELAKVLEEGIAQQQERQQKLLEASSTGDDALVHQLISQKVGIDIKDKQGKNPLMLAAGNGNKEIVKLLLETEKDAVNINGALLLAAQNGHAQIVELLIQAGADSNVRDTKLNTNSNNGYAFMVAKDGISPYGVPVPMPYSPQRTYVQTGMYTNFTPLIHAVINGHEEVVRLLESKGASLTLKDTNGKDALAWAQEKGHAALVAFLKEKLLKVKEVEGAFLKACAEADMPTIQQYLTQDIDGDACDENNRTACELAAEYEHKEVIELLLKHKVHKQKIYRGLKLAIEKGNEPLVTFILGKCGTLTSNNMRPFVETAVTSGNEKMVQLIIKLVKGAHDKATLREYALCTAVRAKNVSLVHKLLSGIAGSWDSLFRSQEVDKNPLFIAARVGSLELVDLFLEKGCSLTVPHYSAVYPRLPVSPVLRAPAVKDPKMTVLMSAAQGGHTDVIERLLKEGINIDDVTSTGDSALTYAAQAGHRAAVELLINKGAKNIHTALTEAVKGGHEDIVQFLIDISPTRQNILDAAFITSVMHRKHASVLRKLLLQGVRLETRMREGKTILMLAIERGYWDIVQFLLDVGANPSTKDARGQDCFTLAKSKGWEDTLSKIIATVSDKKAARQKALLQAAAKGDTASVQELILQGADIQQTDEQGKTVLMYAVTSGSRELVELVARSGELVNIRTKNGISALSIATQRENEAIVNALLRAGAQVDAKSIGMAVSQGNQRILQLLIHDSQDQQQARNWALDATAAFNKHELMMLLLNQGAHINARSPQNRTPLMMAAGKGHEKCVELLLDARADATLQDDEKLDALAYARKNGHETIVRMLEEALSDKYQKQRALFEAAKQGDRELVQDLLIQGVDKDAHDAQGRTALMHAVAHGHKEVIELLVREGANINLIDKGGSDTALSLAVEKADSTLVQLLIAFPDKVTAQTLERALQIAALQGLDEIVKALLAVHTDTVQAASLALHAAVSGQKKALVEQLIDVKADVNSVVEERTPLMRAASVNTTDMIKLLLAHKAAINYRNNRGFTAFDSATEAGSLEALALLMGSENPSFELVVAGQQIFKIQLQQKIGEHLIASKKQGLGGFLEFLIKQNYEEMLLFIHLLGVPDIKVYLKDKASFCSEYIRVYLEEEKCARNEFLQTPFMWACMFGHADIVQQFIESAMPQWFINAQDAYGRTALHYAILYGHTECVQLLLKWYTVDNERIKELHKNNEEALKKVLALSGINLSDNQGNTALFYAITKGDLKLVNELLKINARLSTDERKAALALKIAAAQGWSDIVIRILFKLKDLPAIFK